MTYLRHALAGALFTSITFNIAHAATGVLVTATRLDAGLGDLPSSISVLQREDIESSPARNLPELLKGLPGITTRSLFGNTGNNASIDMRGFGAAAGQNMLLLVDGRRLNDVDLTDPPALPLSSIERIEIIHGGGGVLYGDGAVGGTINIITREAQAPGTRGRIEFDAGSYDTWRTHADMNHNAGPFSLRFSASRLASDGYRDNNDLDQDNLLVDLRHRGNDQEMYLKLNAEDQELRLPGERTVDPGMGIDELSEDRRGTGKPNDYANQKSWAATAGLVRYLGDNTELGVDVGFRHKFQQAFHDDYDFGGAYANYIETDLDTWSITPRLLHRYSAAGLDHRLTVGIDHYRSEYDSDRAQNRSVRDMPIHVLAARADNTGIYAQNSTDLSAATTLTLGTRLQRVHLRASDQLDATAPGAAFATEAAPLDHSEREHMFEAGLRHQINTQWSMFGRVGRSVRFGTIDEIFQTDPDFYVQAFTELKPQTARQLDLGFAYATDATRVSATLFGMRLDNEIHFDPASFSNENLDPTRRHGLELAARTQVFADFELGASYTWLKAQFRDGPYDGNDVPLVPRHSARLDASWQFAPDWQLSGTVQLVGDRRLDNDEDNSFDKLAGYGMLDMKLSTELSGWQLSLTGSNLLDKRAVDYAVRSTFTAGKYNAYPLPGRSAMLNLAREF